MSSGGAAAAGGRQALLLAAMPAVFVGIWSTGFVVARLAMPHALPLGFLSWRYALSALAFALWAAASRAAWPKARGQWLHLVAVGVLMQAGYLGGVWSAVKAGIGAGTVALIVGLQPLLTALWVSAVADAGGGPRVTGRQWAGLLLGLGGLALVVGHKLGLGEVTPANLALSVLALASITAGTLYQKRFVRAADVRSAGCIQMLAALAITLPLALVLEREAVHWHADVVIAMAWSVGVLTLGGSSLLYLLIQRGAATHVASLMYLVPPCTALLAWAMFDEALTGGVLLGLGLCAAGVAMVVQRRG